MQEVERTAEEWFHEAMRSYVASHQGCAWCGGSYRVFKKRDGVKVTFSCHRCDFRVTHDGATGRYLVIPGEAKTSGRAPDTMLGF